MKTILKILLILVVAMMIGGAFYGAVTASSSGTDGTILQERPQPDDFPLDGEFTPPDRGDFDDGVQFPAEMIKNLVIMTVVATAYLNITKYFGRKKPAMPASL